jgi:hypothetical protein
LESIGIRHAERRATQRATKLVQKRLDLGQALLHRAALLRAEGEAGQILDRLYAFVTLALDVVIGRFRGREVKLLRALISDRPGGERHVELTRRQPGE